jgi:hypothetical protein
MRLKRQRKQAHLYEQTWSLKAFEVSAKPAEKKKRVQKKERGPLFDRDLHIIYWTSSLRPHTERERKLAIKLRRVRPHTLVA